MKMVLIIFKKRNNFFFAGERGEMEHFGPKKGASSKLCIRCKNVLQILHNEKGQQVDESKNNGLYLKKIV